MTDAGGERTSGRGGCGLGLAGRPAEVGALFDRHQSAPPYLSAATTGCATSRTTTTQPHRPVCRRLHLDSGRSRPGSRLGYRVPLRGAITDVTPPTGGKSAYEFKAQQESSPART